ncbi:hypothetical protein DAEQUDRAFT_452599 [Daedalea quercina L-15889]|uniref:Uncharacterized protein n=1 Tax=Daedalea quercina L-15889 TaxID=1314783 RepID=A0A165N4N0_9APHY|nr:hypothetical protein DAEQUDRAFT_452599 [Daedalea quercina L-15889]
MKYGKVAGRGPPTWLTVRRMPRSHISPRHNVSAPAGTLPFSCLLLLMSSAVLLSVGCLLHPHLHSTPWLLLSDNNYSVYYFTFRSE